MESITSFTGKYEFLSNFYPCKINAYGLRFKTSEHLYQFSKTFNGAHASAIYNAETPGQAKRLGASCNMRPDWELVKMHVMRFCVTQKFAQNWKLCIMLIDTDGQPIIEGNEWGDTFWGVCNGVGKNYLGMILEETRDYFLMLYAGHPYNR